MKNLGKAFILAVLFYVALAFTFGHVKVNVSQQNAAGGGGVTFFPSFMFSTAPPSSANCNPGNLGFYLTTQLPYFCENGVNNATSSGWVAAQANTLEYCGATSGVTQACAKTLEVGGITVYGNVTLNSAATQAITTLPFTSATSYSCTGSDFTTAAGNITFSAYTSGASATIKEAGGATTDVIYYICSGY